MPNELTPKGLRTIAQIDDACMRLHEAGSPVTCQAVYAIVGRGSMSTISERVARFHASLETDAPLTAQAEAIWQMAGRQLQKQIREDLASQWERQREEMRTAMNLLQARYDVALTDIVRLEEREQELLDQVSALEAQNRQLQIQLGAAASLEEALARFAPVQTEPRRRKSVQHHQGPDDRPPSDAG